MKHFLLPAIILMALACTKQNTTIDPTGTWHIAQMQDMPLVAAEGDELPTLIFDAEGYHLYCGCNHINGSYAIENNMLTLTPGASTKMMCPEVMEMEDALIQLLNGTYTLTESDGTLILTNADSAPILTLIP